MKIFGVIGFATLGFISTLRAQTIEEGKKAIENDQIGKAKSIFSSLLSSGEVNGPSAYYQLSNAYLITGSADSATMTLNKAASLFPKNAFIKAGLGKLELNKGNAPAAKLIFDEAVKLGGSKNASLFLAIGDAYLNNKYADISKAKEFINKSIVLDSKNAEGYMLLGDAYLAENNGGESVTNYEIAAEKNPSFTKAWQHVGVVYTQARNYKAGSEAFEKAIAIDANHPASLRDYADLQYKFRRYEKAKENYEKYLALTGNNSYEALTKHAYILHMAKDYEKEIEVINKLMAMDSSNLVLHRLLAYSSYEKNNYPEGLKQIEIFFEKSDPAKIIPLDYEYWGKLLSKSGNDSLGLMKLEQSFQMDTTNKEILSDMGDIYMKKKNYQSAANAYKSRMLGQENPTAIDYFNFGKASYFNKSYVEADSSFSKVIALKPASGVGYFWRGRTNLNIKEDNMEVAIPFYQKYLEIMAADPKAVKRELVEANKQLGIYYIKKDDNIKAKEFLQKVLDLEPTDKDALEIMSQIK
jgi:tetratricopeptide (TPR) repeat protein